MTPSNYEKSLAHGAYKMYAHSCRTDGRVPWLGVHHWGMPSLSNVTVKPYLSMSIAQQDRLLKLRTIGEENMNGSGVRFIHKLREQSSEEYIAEANARNTNKLEHFSDLYEARHQKHDKKEAVREMGRKRWP